MTFILMVIVIVMLLTRITIVAKKDSGFWDGSNDDGTNVGAMILGRLIDFGE